MEKNIEISAKADFFSEHLNFLGNNDVLIEASHDGIFINGDNVTDVKYNGILLRFIVESNRLLRVTITDEFCKGTMTVKQIYDSLNPFLKLLKA